MNTKRSQRNYQRELTELLQRLPDKKTLFLHCCCAPCSSYVLEYRHSYFHITVFFYNPNITEEPEYEKRREELKRYLREAPFGYEIDVVDADYEPEKFLQMAEGHEKDPERGERCRRCFALRLKKTAEYAVAKGYDYFCTTLSISPHKDAHLLMEIGERLAGQYQVAYLPSDFKKCDGYKRSIALSEIYHLYRQDYCGCIYSKRAREQERAERTVSVR